MKTKTTLTAMALVIAMTFFACKGDTGAPGPAGANGNANVTSSSYTIQPGSWAADGDGGWYTNLTPNGFNPITTALSVYWSTDDADFAALPFVGYTEGAPDVNYALNSAEIQISYNAQTGVSSIAQPTQNVYINVVSVPEQQVAKMRLNHVDMKDYNQVQAYIKLNSK